MSVTNGQQGNETTFNNAFASKTADNVSTGNQNLNDADAASGTQVTNVQREHNSIASYVGKAINALKDILPSWTSTAVGTGTDNLTQRAEALTVESGALAADISTNAADILLRQLLSEKSQINGYASLDGGGQVPLAELPDSVTGAREFLGQWVASTNTPTLANGDVENAGAEYNASDDGTVDFGAGNIVFTQGDTVIYDGAVWSKIDGSVVRDINDIRDVDTSGVTEGDYLRKSAGDYLAFDPDQISDDAATGANQTLTAITDQAVIRLTNVGLTSVDMIPAEVKARRFILVNDTGVAVDINDLTGATAANQIITGTGLDLTLEDQGALFFVYDTTDAKWRVVGGSGGGGSFPLLAPDGTGAAPSYSWASDPDTGIFKSGSGMRFAVDGNQKLDLQANGDFIPGANQDLGNVGEPWAQVHSTRHYASDGSLRGVFQGGTSLSNPGGFANVQAYLQTQQQAGAALSVQTRDDFGVDAAKAGNLYLQGGRKINGTGDGGDVIAHMGTSLGGARGNFAIQDGTEGIVGKVWTSKGNLGEGEWQDAQGTAGLSIVTGNDSSFEVDDINWGTYVNSADNKPTNGDGGVPDVTATQTAVGAEVVHGLGSLKCSKDAVNRQGQGFVLGFQAVDKAFRGKSNRISFNYEASATFDFGTISTDSDVTVWGYCQTTGTLLPLNNFRLSGEGRFESDVFIPSGCSLMRFILHISTTNAAAWDLFVDDFLCELVPFTSFNNMSDWVDGGPVTIDATTSAPTKGTTTIDRVMYRYVGDSAHIKIEFDQNAAGTAGSGTYILRLPADIGEIDTTKITTNSNLAAANSPEVYASSIGYGGWGSAVAGYHMSAHAYDETGFVIVMDQKGALAANYFGSAFGSFGTADVGFSVEIKVPIVGRTSGAKHPAAIGLNAKAVMRADKTGGGTTANVTIPSWTNTEDSIGSFNATTGVYTVKSPGDYHVDLLLATTAANILAQIRVNGTVKASNGWPGSNYATSATVLPNLKYGDEITATTNANSTLGSGLRNVFSIHKIGSEQQPYAPRVAYLKDHKANTVGGGTFTQDAWQTRDLNTFSGDQSFVSVSANQFTLEPGTYHINAKAPAFTVSRNKIKLRNITDATDDIIGISTYTSASAGYAQTNADLEGAITISVATAFEIQHYCENTTATSGFGVSSNFGVDEVYTQVKLTKIL